MHRRAAGLHRQAFTRSLISNPQHVGSQHALFVQRLLKQWACDVPRTKHSWRAMVPVKQRDTAKRAFIEVLPDLAQWLMRLTKKNATGHDCLDLHAENVASGIRERFYDLCSGTTPTTAPSSLHATTSGVSASIKKASASHRSDPTQIFAIVATLARRRGKNSSWISRCVVPCSVVTAATRARTRITADFWESAAVGARRAHRRRLLC